MRKLVTKGSGWVWMVVLVLAGLLVLGLVILPDVLGREVPFPGTPRGLYVMNLITLGMFLGVVVSMAVERFERPAVILFVAFRIGETAWEFELGRHSLWYLAGSVFAHLLVGSAVLLFLSHRKENNRKEEDFPEEF